MNNPSPMFLQNVHTFKNFPVQQKQRKWTDCCCTIITAIFALILFILSFVMFTKNNYYQVNFPADDKGITCYNQLHDYPFMFFKDPLNPTAGRYCLRQCPLNGQAIQCASDGKANCGALQSSYDTVVEINDIGAFCAPQNQDIRNQLFSAPQLGNKLALTKSYNIIRFTFLFGFLCGLLYLVIVSLASSLVTHAAYILAAIVLVASALYLLIKPVILFDNYVYTVILAIVLIVIAIAHIVYLMCYTKQIQLSSILIKHANNFLKQTPAVFVYIIVFVILTLGLLALIIWQYVAFGTAYEPTFQVDQIYYHSNYCWILQVLNVIELIWGLQFLRDAFNFVVSGNAVQWYFREKTNSNHCVKPFVRLLTKHWGSVVGGSFLNAFFKLFDLFSDCFNCDSKGQCGRCQNYYQDYCCCNYILQLLRTDSYSYINLAGIPYCNAARQCQALCRYSTLINSSHSCLRTYRHAAHIFVIGLAAFICYVIIGFKTEEYGNYNHFWILAVVVLVAYSMATFFVDIHQNAAEAIIICYLAEENCEGQRHLEFCPRKLRDDIQHYRVTYQNYQPDTI